MSKKANPTLIGVFTLIGLLLAAGAIVAFGAGKFFQETTNIMLYFDKSAYGLQVGSDVRFGGVRIGRVSSIRVLIDPKENRKIIPVVVELSEKALTAVGSTTGSAIDFSSDAGVRKAVREGLRARMKQQSLLTGQLYVEFDIVPDMPGFVYQPEAPPPYPIVPTVGTEFDELIAGIAEGLKKFNALDLDSAMNEVREVLTSAKKQIAALEMKKINDNLIQITSDIRELTGNEKLAKAIDSLDEALTGIDELTKKANEGFDPLMEDLEGVMAKLDESMVKIDAATDDISKATNPRSPTLLRMRNVLGEVERASRSLQETANELKRNPNAILGGRKLRR
jgi:paraquat-inducible protein B